jgi:hypothetical protein
MDFEWDEAKRKANLRKHGIDFADAMRIWDGEVLEQIDLREDHAEDRYRGIGLLDDRCIVVAFTWRGSRLRMISARKAERHERQAYDEALARGFAPPKR